MKSKRKHHSKSCEWRGKAPEAVEVPAPTVVKIADELKYFVKWNER